MYIDSRVHPWLESGADASSPRREPSSWHVRGLIGGGSAQELALCTAFRLYSYILRIEFWKNGFACIASVNIRYYT